MWTNDYEWIWFPVFNPQPKHIFSDIKGKTLIQTTFLMWWSPDLSSQKQLLHSHKHSDLKQHHLWLKVKYLTFHFNLISLCFDHHKICRTQRPWSSLSATLSSPANCSKWRNLGTEKVNHNKAVTSKKSTLAAFQFLAPLHFRKQYFSKDFFTIGFFQMVSGGSGGWAPITSGCLVGWNPTYQVFLKKQSQIDEVEFTKIIKLLCFQRTPSRKWKDDSHTE